MTRKNLLWGIALRCALGLFVTLVMALGMCPAVGLADEVEVVTQGEEDVVEAQGTEGTEEPAVHVETVPESEYCLYISGNPVTNDNRGNVLGDGTVSFTPEGAGKPATLTLNNANIPTKGSNAGIEYQGDKPLTIDIKGENFVDFSNFSGDDDSYGILAKNNEGAITIVGTGSLTAKGKTSGIASYSNITINGGTVNASGKLGGIHCANSVTVNGGIVKAESTVEYDGTDYDMNTLYYGIYGRDVTINGGTVTASSLAYSIYSIERKLTIGDRVAVMAGDNEASAIDHTADFATNYDRYPWAKTTIIIPVESVTVDPTSATLTVGQTKQLKATVKPDDATDKTVAWKSDNEAVAKVDANGKVTAVSAGKATITATADGKSATCVVTVNAVPPAKVGKPSTSGHPAKGTLDVSWKSAKGAKSYEVQWRKVGGKWKTKAAESRKLTISGLKKGTAYEVRVRAKAGSVAGEWSAVVRRWLRGSSSVKAKAGFKSGTVDVSWKKDKKATGGTKVYVYAKKGGKLVKTAKAEVGKASITVSGLKAGKKYFVRVRPARKASGKTYTGSFSGYQSVRAAK